MTSGESIFPTKKQTGNLHLKKILTEKYVLASKSPRRIQLLRQIGLDFVSVDSKVSELELEDHDPISSVRHNSVAKSRKVAEKYKDNIVIGADTIVMLEKKILNKPSDLAEARKFLKMLSGKKHVVYTGINVINGKTGREIFGYEKTGVYFKDLSEEEINYYVEKYKPLDKAGGYGIQDDFGCLFIKKITGDYYNIVGLPVVKLYQIIQKIN